MSSLPVVLYVLYMPTFLALDALNVGLFWGLVHVGQGMGMGKGKGRAGRWRGSWLGVWVAGARLFVW